MPVEDPARRRRAGRVVRDVVRVRAGVGLGDREGEVVPAAADPAQPAVLLLGRAVPRRGPCRRSPGETSSGSSGHPAALTSSSDDRQLVQAEPAAVVLRGDVDAEEAVVGQRVPQLAAAGGPPAPRRRRHGGRSRARCRARSCGAPGSRRSRRAAATASIPSPADATRRPPESHWRVRQSRSGGARPRRARAAGWPRPACRSSRAGETRIDPPWSRSSSRSEVSPCRPAPPAPRPRPSSHTSSVSRLRRETSSRTSTRQGPACLAALTSVSRATLTSASDAARRSCRAAGRGLVVDLEPDRDRELVLHARDDRDETRAEIGRGRGLRQPADDVADRRVAADEQPARVADALRRRPRRARRRASRSRRG